MKPKTRPFPFRLQVNHDASYPFRIFEAAKEFARRQFPAELSYITHDGERIWIRKDGRETEFLQADKDTA